MALNDDLMCCICLDYPDDPTIVCKCGKVCCNKCIKDWISKNSSCPMCRALISEATIIKCNWITEVIHVIEGMSQSNKELKQLNSCLTKQVKGLEGELNNTKEKVNEDEKKMERMKKTIADLELTSLKQHLNKLELGNTPDEISDKLKRASAKLMNQALSVFEKLQRDESVPVESITDMETLTDEVNRLKLNYKIN